MNTLPGKLVEVLFARRPSGADLGAVLRSLGSPPGEELVDERVHLADLGVAEVPGEKRREIVDHPPPLHFADRLGRRADEYPAVLVLPVLLVVADLDRRRFLGIRRERGESALERVLEIAPDVAGPADVERAPAPVEDDAGLV